TLLRGGRRMHSDNGDEIHHHLGVSAFSDYVVVDRSSAVAIDKEVPFDIAAIFGCAMLTGCGAVRNTAQVQPGESVAVIGLGGVGQAAILGAVVSQAAVIVAIDPVPNKRELALSLGATHACSPEDAATVVAAATNGLGVQYAFEAAGVVPAMEQAFTLTAKGGTMVSVGLPSPSAQLSLPAVSFVAEAKSIVGSYMGSSVPQRDIPMMINLWKQGKLPVDKLMSGTLPLNSVNEAMDLLAKGNAVRQILVP
ncbi:MAG: zinc-binding dehydrogenase, partial [Mycobacteriaceae bacterium]